MMTMKSDSFLDCDGSNDYLAKLGYLLSAFKRPVQIYAGIDPAFSEGQPCEVVVIEVSDGRIVKEELITITGARAYLDQLRLLQAVVGMVDFALIDEAGRIPVLIDQLQAACGEKIEGRRFGEKIEGRRSGTIERGSENSLAHDLAVACIFTRYLPAAEASQI